MPPEPEFDGDTAVNRTIPDEISPYMPQAYAGDPIVLTPPVKHKTVAHKHWKTPSVLRSNIVYNNRNNNKKTNSVISTPLPAHDDTKAEKNVGQHSSVVFKSDSIKPVNVWDNGEFTYFKFPEKIDLPTLFVIGQDGKESVVNSSVTGESHNIVAAQMVAEKWVIRFGDKVIGIKNTAFNPRAAFAGHPTDTTSPDQCQSPWC